MHWYPLSLPEQVWHLWEILKTKQNKFTWHYRMLLTLEKYSSVRQQTILGFSPVSLNSRWLSQSSVKKTLLYKKNLLYSKQSNLTSRFTFLCISKYLKDSRMIQKQYQPYGTILAMHITWGNLWKILQILTQTNQSCEIRASTQNCTALSGNKGRCLLLSLI